MLNETFSVISLIFKHHDSRIQIVKFSIFKFFQICLRTWYWWNVAVSILVIAKKCWILYKGCVWNASICTFPSITMWMPSILAKWGRKLASILPWMEISKLACNGRESKWVCQYSHHLQMNETNKCKSLIWEDDNLLYWCDACEKRKLKSSI